MERKRDREELERQTGKERQTGRETQRKRDPEGKPTRKSMDRNRERQEETRVHRERGTDKKRAS